MLAGGVIFAATGAPDTVEILSVPGTVLPLILPRLRMRPPPVPSVRAG